MPFVMCLSALFPVYGKKESWVPSILSINPAMLIKLFLNKKIISVAANNTIIAWTLVEIL